MALPAPFDQAIMFLPTEKPVEAARFYGETLGLPKVYERPGVTIYRAGQGFVGLISAPGRKATPGGLTVALRTPDVDGWYARLSAAGCATDAPPQYADGLATYFFMTRDPDGYRVEVLDLRDPDWPAGGQS